MCGRYTLTSQEQLVDAFELAAAEPISGASEWWRPRFNIAPTQPAPVILLRDGVRVLELMKWGLTGSAKLINARKEGVTGRPAFRDAVKTRRCLIPADGFFEWQGEGKAKQPIYFRPVPHRPVAFAGLWELGTFTIITGPPNDLVAPVHDRMPVVLAPSAYAAWLAPEPLAPEALAELLAVPAIADWQGLPVNKKVGSPANDDPACIEPASDAGTPAAEAPAQGKLF